MSPFVLDASLALSWAFEDEGDEASLRVLDLLQRRAAMVPAIWPLEVGNGLRSAERRRRIARADAIRFLELLRGLPIEVQPPVGLSDLERVYGLACEHELSVYDAGYLDLAMKQGLQLASLDEPLRKACKAVGCKLL